MSKRPPKIDALMDVLRDALRGRMIRHTEHSQERMQQRGILNTEVICVLENGYHEAKKDEFNEMKGVWNYAIRGKTAEGRRLRIGVAVYAPDVLIITAIDLDQENE